MQQLPCSDVEVEPLPGTAKPGSVYVLIEWPEAWPRDVMGDAALGEELTSKLKPKLDEYNATLLPTLRACRAEPAPSAAPVNDCAAMANESKMRDMKFHSCIMIW